MPTLTHDAVIDAMRTVQEPELGRDLISLDMVKDVVIDGTALAMTMADTRPPQDSSFGAPRAALYGAKTTAQGAPGTGTRASTFFDAMSMIATSLDGPFAV